MRFMLLIRSDESDVVSPTEHMTMPDFIAWYDGMERQGRLRGGDRLRPSAEGATVRVCDGEGGAAPRSPVRGDRGAADLGILSSARPTVDRAGAPSSS